MPKLKREIFMRPARFTHRFGNNDDPYSDREYFDLKGPTLPKSINAPSQSANIKRNGLHVYTEPSSGVDKFCGGKASLGGPRLDEADKIGEREPLSTRRRKVTAGAE